MSEKSIILIRTSTKEQNPQLQLKECEEFNKKNDWELVKIFEKQESAYKNEDGVWKDEVDFCINNKIKHIIVWNMDRFSRLPEEKVLSQVKIMGVIHGLNLHAVHGDVWSELVESISKLKDMGFIGEALLEFLEKLLRGLEFQRANRESKVKSERVKLAVRKKEGEKTKSYKGNKWGRKSVSTMKKNQLREIIELEPKIKIRELAERLGLSVGVVHKYRKELSKEKEINIMVHQSTN